MASEVSISERVRRRLPRPAWLAAAGLLGLAAGFGYAALEGGGSEPAPATVASRAGESRPTASAVATPVGIDTATSRASADLARGADEAARRDLTRSLAAARRGGGSPIAIAESRTGLRAEPAGRTLERLRTRTEFGSPRVHAVVGREGRWLEVMAAELPNDETAWIDAADVDVEGIDYSLTASLAARTLVVHRDGRVVRRVPVAVGGPSTPTPTGTFAVTDKLRMTGGSAAYGCCALAFTGHQPNVPQGWSGGDRLAVHGTGQEAAIGQAVSVGCLRAGRADMRWLIDKVPLGTPVTVTP